MSVVNLMRVWKLCFVNICLHYQYDSPPHHHHCNSYNSCYKWKLYAHAKTLGECYCCCWCGYDTERKITIDLKVWFSLNEPPPLSKIGWEVPIAMMMPSSNLNHVGVACRSAINSYDPSGDPNTLEKTGSIKNTNLIILKFGFGFWIIHIQ